MAEKQRSKSRTTVAYKVVFLAALLFIGWQLLHIEAVLNALMLFGMVGEIPGTNIQLSPDAVLKLLPALLLLAVVVIFHQNLWRGVRRLFARQPVAPPKQIVITIPGRPGLLKIWLGRCNLRVRGWLQPVIMWLRQVAPATVRVRVVLAKYARAAMRILRLLGRIIRYESYALGRWLARQAVAFWQWLEPRMRDFDAWLGKQLHAQLRKDHIKPFARFARECSRSAKALWRRLRGYLSTANSNDRSQ